MTGAWNVGINVGAMPQKVATAVGKMSESLMGAEYEPICYLGSQVVNGTNHAVLCEQTIITGRDTKNIVVVVFNEKPNEMELTLVRIDTIVEGGLPMGGTAIDVKTDIPDDAKAVWEDAFDGMVGSNVEPFALLGTQVVNGVNYIFGAVLTPVVANPMSKAVVVTINEKSGTVKFADMLVSKQGGSLGYAFTW